MTVEFALIAPILFAVLAAAYDLGSALQRSIRMQSIARAGATYAALVPSDTNNSAASAMNALLSNISGAHSTVSLACRCPPSTSTSTGPVVNCSTVCSTGMATYVTVTVSAPFVSLFPLSPFIPFDNIGATSAKIVLRVS